MLTGERAGRGAETTTQILLKFFPKKWGDTKFLQIFFLGIWDPCYYPVIH